MPAFSLSAAQYVAQPTASFKDFGAYLKQSLNDPFVLNLRESSLMEVIAACINAKSRLHPNYASSIGCLVNNLTLLEKEYSIKLKPVQITDIFWGYFISFCQGRGLRMSTIETLCNQLRSILNWATKYNAMVSPTYADMKVSRTRNFKIALSADEISRIDYFDIDRFYADKRVDFRRKMERVRDMFVLQTSLFQRHSDAVRINKSCFNRNIFRITQQKTGNVAIVDIDKYAIDAKTTYRILEKYNYEAPYKASIGNYNSNIHILMRDIGFDDLVRIEEKIGDKMVVREVPKWQLISSHTCRRSAITINVLRGHNVHDLKRCSGHVDLRVFDSYVRDE